MMHTLSLAWWKRQAQEQTTEIEVHYSKSGGRTLTRPGTRRESAKHREEERAFQARRTECAEAGRFRKICERFPAVCV